MMLAETSPADITKYLFTVSQSLPLQSAAAVATDNLPHFYNSY
jgi:hypothetical protein